MAPDILSNCGSASGNRTVLQLRHGIRVTENPSTLLLHSSFGFGFPLWMSFATNSPCIASPWFPLPRPNSFHGDLFHLQWFVVGKRLLQMVHQGYKPLAPRKMHVLHHTTPPWHPLPRIQASDIRENAFPSPHNPTSTSFTRYATHYHWDYLDLQQL